MFTIYRQPYGQWHFRLPSSRRPHKYSTGYPTREAAQTAADDAEKSVAAEESALRPDRKSDCPAEGRRVNHDQHTH